MNKCMFIGTLCKECELQESKAGKTYLNNSIAVPNSNDGTDFFNITAFGKTAEVIAKWFTKGSRIGVEAHASQNIYESNGRKINSINFIVEKVDFCEKKGSLQTSTDGENADNVSEDLPFN